eukprot:scaffold213542_cov27-Tisochrysis_lutea.AAC.1
MSGLVYEAPVFARALALAQNVTVSHHHLLKIETHVVLANGREQLSSRVVGETSTLLARGLL